MTAKRTVREQNAELYSWLLPLVSSGAIHSAATRVERPSADDIAGVIAAVQARLVEASERLKREERAAYAHLDSVVAHAAPGADAAALRRLIAAQTALSLDDTDKPSERWMSAGDVAPALLETLLEAELLERHPENPSLVRRNELFRLDVELPAHDGTTTR